MKEDRPKSFVDGTLRTASQLVAPTCIAESDEENSVRPEGFEPPTLGSEDAPDGRRGVLRGYAVPSYIVT
jgi:hypothetical protein